MSDADPPRGLEPLTPRQEIEHTARAFLWLMRLSDPRPEIPFVAMPSAIRALIVERIGLGPVDRLIDIGCGDGQTVIELARLSGCRAVGFERDPDRINQARAALAAEQGTAPGLGERVDFIQGDFEDAEQLDRLPLAESTVALMFLYPWAVALLVPLIVERMPPTARVVSYTFADDHHGHGTREMVPGFAYPGHRVPLYVWTVAELAQSMARG